MELITKTSLPQAFDYPIEFLRIVSQGLINLDPWIIMDGYLLFSRYEGLKIRYPSRILVPFARRLDNDDVACWDINRGNAVVLIHDFASAGWEQMRIYDHFWHWFKTAIDDMIEHEIDSSDLDYSKFRF